MLGLYLVSFCSNVHKRISQYHRCQTTTTHQSLLVLVMHLDHTVEHVWYQVLASTSQLRIEQLLPGQYLVVKERSPITGTSQVPGTRYCQVNYYYLHYYLPVQQVNKCRSTRYWPTAVLWCMVEVPVESCKFSIWDEYEYEYFRELHLSTYKYHFTWYQYRTVPIPLQPYSDSWYRSTIIKRCWKEFCRPCRIYYLLLE